MQLTQLNKEAAEQTTGLSPLRLLLPLLLPGPAASGCCQMVLGSLVVLGKRQAEGGLRAGRMARLSRCVLLHRPRLQVGGGMGGDGLQIYVFSIYLSPGWHMST